VRKLKSEKQLSLKTPIACMKIFTQNSTLSDELAQHDQLIRGVTQALQVTYQEGADQQAQLRQDGEQWHAHIVLE
jgi:hypothetical protein